MADGELAEAGAEPRAALRYRVEGMDCPSCAGKIETAVGRLDGAKDIRVNYHTQVLALRLDEAATPRVTVKEQVRKLCYGIAPVEAPKVVPGDTGTATEAEVRGPAPQPWWKSAKARLAAILGA